MSDRRIEIPCASGDEARLEVTTEGQDVDAVLKFRVYDDLDSYRSVYVSSEDMAKLLAFAHREWAAWSQAFTPAGDPA